MQAGRRRKRLSAGRPDKQTKRQAFEQRTDGAIDQGVELQKGQPGTQSGGQLDRQVTRQVEKKAGRPVDNGAAADREADTPAGLPADTPFRPPADTLADPAAATPADTPGAVALVCDFFFPRLGGVEMHLWSLAQALLQRNRKVIIVTHAFGDRKGLRYMDGGLKVYYLPLVPMVEGVAFPTFFSFFHLFRRIVLSEGIRIVHGHQATSCMTNEAILYARTLGLTVCYTDHSLFGFTDAASVHINKVLRFTLSDIDHAIAVSHTCRENLIARAGIPPERVSVIPNAIDASRFQPDPTQRRPRHTVNIVVISRLVYRKGRDLLARVIPRVCARHPEVHFIIAGDGSKRGLLEAMREEEHLHDRVELLGSIPHGDVREVLVRGQIFLNCSLTESFCIAIVEAAAAGLLVVSTPVGGIPEVLPEHMMRLSASTHVDDVTSAVSEAMTTLDAVEPHAFHAQVSGMYRWSDVAGRTETVYRRAASQPVPSFTQRLRRYLTVGPIAGLLCCFIVTAMRLYASLLDAWEPRASIPTAAEFHLAFKQHRARRTRASKGVDRNPK